MDLTYKLSEFIEEHKQNTKRDEWSMVFSFFFYYTNLGTDYVLSVSMFVMRPDS